MKRKKAVALHWDPDSDPAPRLIASGKGALADKILQLAEEAGIEIIENTELTESLLPLELGKAIPPQLYALAAEVYIFLRNLDLSFQKDKT